MSALEDEIIAKFGQLDDAAKQRVLEKLSLVVKPAFDTEAWLKGVISLREEIRAELDEGETIDTLALLHEARDERS
jgi:hypothetical protein